MSDFIDNFRLPTPTLKQLTFCDADLESVADWLHQQRLEQGAHMSVLLYKLLPEINLLQTSVENRLQLLNLIRPHVYTCVQGLTQGYLQQPLHAPGKTLQFGSITLALLRHLADGFLICFGQELSQGPDNKKRSDLSSPLYLAIQTMGHLFFQHCRLYMPPQLLFWYKAHQSYALALEHDLADEKVVDTLLEKESFSSIKTAYYRLIMLATSNTNQLKLEDIKHLYQTLEQWYVLGISSLTEQNNLSIWVNPELDMPPYCRETEQGEVSLQGDKQQNGNCWQFDLSLTVELLLTHNAHRPGHPVAELPTYFRHSLGEHLIECWRSSKQRQHVRSPCNEMFEISIGLDNACRLLANDVEITPENGDKNDISLVSVVDVSESGYCLRWQGHAPEGLDLGQCLLMRPADRRRWKILVVRWAQRINQYVYAGVRLLAEEAVPASLYSVQVEDKGKQHLPAIALQQSLSVDQPTLMLPSDITCGEWQLMIQSETNKAPQEKSLTLTSCAAQFGVVSQFCFEYQ